MQHVGVAEATYPMSLAQVGQQLLRTGKEPFRPRNEFIDKFADGTRKHPRCDEVFGKLFRWDPAEFKTSNQRGFEPPLLQGIDADWFREQSIELLEAGVLDEDAA